MIESVAFIRRWSVRMNNEDTIVLILMKMALKKDIIHSYVVKRGI